MDIFSFKGFENNWGHFISNQMEKRPIKKKIERAVLPDNGSDFSFNSNLHIFLTKRKSALESNLTLVI